MDMYSLYDIEHQAAEPFMRYSKMLHSSVSNPLNPLSWTLAGRMVGAGIEVFDSLTSVRGKPEWQINTVKIKGQQQAIAQTVLQDLPFAEIRRFSLAKADASRPAPVLIVAPMSGHYATLLRDTVRRILEERDVIITDWKNARDVPLEHGNFGVNHYMDYIHYALEAIGPHQEGGGGAHAIAVCQPAPLLLAMSAVLAEDQSPVTPRSLTLMGGPVNTRAASTLVTQLAENRPLSWFRHQNIHRVPARYEGSGRLVYPGFLQLIAFWSMNPARHGGAHWKMFKQLVRGDDESAERTRDFYDEYMAVLDVTGEFYLETVNLIFQKHSLPKCEFRYHRNRLVKPSSLTKTGLLTIEGELDDISAPGQTIGAHELCPQIPDAWQEHILQKGVGHYGIFNGRRWREAIAPRILDFMARIDNEWGQADQNPTAKVEKPNLAKSA